VFGEDFDNFISNEMKYHYNKAYCFLGMVFSLQNFTVNIIDLLINFPSFLWILTDMVVLIFIIH